VKAALMIGSEAFSSSQAAISLISVEATPVRCGKIDEIF
jgi:hypothetical protein